MGNTFFRELLFLGVGVCLITYSSCCLRKKISVDWEQRNPQKTPKHAKARFRDVFHHPGVVRSRVGASLSLRSSLGNVLTHVTSRKARKKHSLFHSYKKQRGNDKACSLIFITFQKSKTKRTTASRITFRPFHFTLSTPCCVLFAPRLASLSSSSVHV